MEKISIKNTAVNIFKPATRTQETKHSNPFGLSFKGNVLQADVFSSAKTKSSEPTGVFGRIAEKGRAVKSAIVGGINNFNTAIWKKANETNIVWDFNGLSESFRGFASMDVADIIGHRKDSYQVKDLVKHPVSELETMFRTELDSIKG